MICRDFPVRYSALLDGDAGADEQAILETHTRTCLACRRAAGEMRSLCAELGALSRPQPGTDLSSQVIAALSREARLRAQAAGKRADKIDLWRVRLFSQSVGTVVSLSLVLVVTFGVLRPAYRALAAAFPVIETTVEEYVVPGEVRFRVLLLEPPPPPPVFNPSGALLGFSESLSEDDILIATVKVRKDGRASLKALAETPRDPSALDRLSNALFRQANFQPSRHKQNSSPDAVLMFSKINISG